MLETLSKRLKELQQKSGLNSRQFALQNGIDPSQFAKAMKGVKTLGMERLIELSTKYNVDLKWLVSGDDASTPQPPANARDLGQPIATHSAKNGNQFVELTGGNYIMYTKLVTQKASAGYMTGWGDDEFLEELPIHPILVQELHKGVYRSFEITGDSMDDSSKASIEEGDIVTGRQINRSLWKSAFHTKKYPDFIIVHRTEGITCKRIIAHDTDKGTITCHSLNPDKKRYPDFEVALDDCLQIFNIVQVTKPR